MNELKDAVYELTDSMDNNMSKTNKNINRK